MVTYDSITLAAALEKARKDTEIREAPSCSEAFKQNKSSATCPTLGILHNTNHGGRPLFHPVKVKWISIFLIWAKRRMEVITLPRQQGKGQRQDKGQEQRQRRKRPSARYPMMQRQMAGRFVGPSIVHMKDVVHLNATLCTLAQSASMPVTLLILAPRSAEHNRTVITQILEETGSKRID